MDRNIKNRIAIKCILVELSALVTFFINPNQPLLLVAIISTISGLIGAASYFALPEFSSVFLLVRFARKSNSLEIGCIRDKLCANSSLERTIV